MQVISLRFVLLIAFCVLSNRCASVETHELSALSAPALFDLGWGRPKWPIEHLEAERLLHPVTNGLVFVTELHGSAQITDYSGAIFALVAITSVLTAAVVFVLAQPTDLPVIKKTQG